MTISDDIFQLIKSLNKNEKTYFKKFAQLHVLGEENSYILLFDAIEAQEKYDEKALIQKFSAGKSASQFSVLKNYLYNLILKSLRNYHSEDTVRAELKQQLQNVNILVERGLRDQAEKLLRRCRKTAEQHELFRELIEVSAIEHNFLVFGKSFDKETIEAVNRNLDERRQVLQKMQNSHDYDRIEYNLAHHLQSDAPQRLGQAGQLLKDGLMKSEKNALSVVSLLKFHHIYATFFYYSGKAADCIKHMLKEVGILEQYEHIMQLRLQDYVLLNNNILLLLLEQGDLKKFDERLRQFRTKFGAYRISTRLWEQAVAHSYIVEMQRHYTDFDYRKIETVAAEMLKQLNGSKAKLNLTDQFAYTDLMAKACLKERKFDKALEFSIQLLNHAEAAQKFNQYPLARLLNLLIHFELGNFDLLDYQIQSFQRQVMKADKGNALYNAIIPFLKKYPSATDRKQRQVLLEKLSKEIVARGNSKYFDFGEWAKQLLKA